MTGFWLEKMIAEYTTNVVSLAPPGFKHNFTRLDWVSPADHFFYILQQLFIIKMAKIFLILNALFIIVTTNLYAQQEYKDSLDFKLIRAFKKTKAPGLTAIIVSKHGIVYQKNLGYANSIAHLPYTAQTLENIGSVSKTFIAVALMKAVDMGYFNLETAINDILPFKVTNPYFPNRQITIRQLTTHTSGIIDNDSIYHKSYKFIITDSSSKAAMSAMSERGYTGGLTDTLLETFLQNYLSAGGSLYSHKNFYSSKPGERSAYSNIGSSLAAYISQLKAGMSFAAFCEKYILHPLHMNSSAWFLDEVDMNKHAIPYAAPDLPLPFYSLTTYPDGGLIASGDDLTKYAMEMINSLNGHAQLISKKSIEVMFAPAFPTDSLPQNFNATKRTKGVFWNLYTDGFIGHDGDDPGVSTNILFNKKCGIIFMTNIYIEDRSDFLNALKEYAGRILK